MTGRILIVGSGDGRRLTAMLAVSATSLGQALIAASKQYEEAAVRGRIEAELAALELSAINSAAKFRDLAAAMAKFQVAPVEFPMQRAGAPAFGSARPYLKKKKGRS
ncbi:UNVERIFIED_ORG: hypothetical protein JN05_01222 [Zoogloea ramigera]|uniref:Uncharacterized protein n=1 Tax=Duganella zoogloeoides TaxID=75659 RepID=A0ABZ0Y5T6_9BURK|nr:hypothetical protein [Duganella zoogloeoides]WQH06827.1 hypothetical protein SR858_11005 [Duganella zoogloeoides]